MTSTEQLEDHHIFDIKPIKDLCNSSFQIVEALMLINQNAVSQLRFLLSFVQSNPIKGSLIFENDRINTSHDQNCTTLSNFIYFIEEHLSLEHQYHVLISSSLFNKSPTSILPSITNNTNSNFNSICVALSNSISNMNVLLNKHPFLLNCLRLAYVNRLNNSFEQIESEPETTITITPVSNRKSFLPNIKQDKNNNMVYKRLLKKYNFKEILLNNDMDNNNYNQVFDNIYKYIDYISNQFQQLFEFRDFDSGEHRLVRLNREYEEISSQYHQFKSIYDNQKNEFALKTSRLKNQRDKIRTSIARIQAISVNQEEGSTTNKNSSLKSLSQEHTSINQNLKTEYSKFSTDANSIFQLHDKTSHKLKDSLRKAEDQLANTISDYDNEMLDLSSKVEKLQVLLNSETSRYSEIQQNIQTLKQEHLKLTELLKEQERNQAKQLAKVERAAITIQSRWRGFVCRKKIMENKLRKRKPWLKMKTPSSSTNKPNQKTQKRIQSQKLSQKIKK